MRPAEGTGVRAGGWRWARGENTRIGRAQGLGQGQPDSFADEPYLGRCFAFPLGRRQRGPDPDLSTGIGSFWKGSCHPGQGSGLHSTQERRGAGIQRLQLDLEFREGGIYITDTRSLKDSDYPWIKSFHKQASEKLSYTEVTQRCRGKKIPCGIIIIVKDQKPHTSSPLGAG